MRVIPSIFCLILLLSCPVLAENVILKTDRDHYTFRTGEEARIPFIVESSFPGTNVGELIYMLTRTGSQGGFTFTQSSSQSQSFPISPGRSQNAITLGSEEPADFEVTLSLQYRDDGTDISADLPPFRVHFISGEPEESNQSSGNNPLSSTSREVRSASSAPVQNPFTDMEERMNAIQQQNQQLIQQAFSSPGMPSGAGGNRPHSPDPRQALQNNQMTTPSSTLQKQLAEETDRRAEEERDFKEQISRDPLLNQVNADLNKAGYQQREASVQRDGEEEGTLTAGFADEDGNQVHLQADIRNGTTAEVTTRSDTAVPLPTALSSSEEYQNRTRELEDAGFTRSQGTRIDTPSETRVEEVFHNEQGRNATVTSLIRNGTVTAVTVQREEETPLAWYSGLALLLILACLCAWAGYRYHKIWRRITDDTPESGGESAVDFREETELLLARAGQSCSEGRIKDAYAQAGQALRYYLSHQLGCGEARTSEEIITLAEKKGVDTREIESILESCILVEFARNEGDHASVRAIISKIRMITRDMPGGGKN